ncbi:MAG: HD domain-containing protein [Candidatus Woesearchaeota archaeon]
MSQIELAQEYCKIFHEGIFRKDNVTPYYTHPFAVADILKNYGYSDEETQIIAYLHDTIEDTPLRLKEIRTVFGPTISLAVFQLSRNKGETLSGEKLNDKQYMDRILYSWPRVQRVKIADMIDNTKTLEALSDSGIEKKIKESNGFYIPLGKKVAPMMVGELEENIENYLLKSA